MPTRRPVPPADRARARRRRPLRRLTGVTALVLGLVLSGPAASAAPADAWTSADAGAGHSRNNPGETVITPANAGQVRQAWGLDRYTGMTVAPAVAAGVAYHAVTPSVVSEPGTFTATSVRTGATLWTVRLPGNATYQRGVSVSGRLAVLSFDGFRRAGGVLAVDLTTRRVVWTRALPAPAPAFAWMGNPPTTAGPVTVDGTRVYVTGAGYAVNAYRLSDGAPLWRTPMTTSAGGTPNALEGIAAAGTVVYTGGDEGVVAHDAASGRRLWTAPGQGAPVIAGSRVLSAVHDGVVAVAASGCGRPTCSALWRSRVPEVFHAPLLGGADASTAFLTYTRARSTGGLVGVLARFSVATGTVQWMASAGTWLSEPVRAGGTVWLRNEHRPGGGSEAYRLLAWSATGSGTSPLRSVALPADRQGVTGGLAVSGGTVVTTTWPRYLDGFRVPGT